MTRLGFDVRKGLQHCIASIDAQRLGEPPPSTVVRPRFENELLTDTTFPPRPWITEPAETESML